jgi:2-haloacid dehalogenase
VSKHEVLAFDLYGTLVDPIGIASELDRLLSGDGKALAHLWRSKQLEYSFRISVMDRYQDFRWITTRALDDALTALTLTLADDDKTRLIWEYDHLAPFPDVIDGLTALAAGGCELTVLSNGSPGMIENCLNNSGLRTYFSAWVSADEVRTFKPSPRVYQRAASRLGRSLSELRLVSSNPFDVVGANAVGMRTAWVNRSGAKFETVGGQPDVTVSDLAQLCFRLGI